MNYSLFPIPVSIGLIIVYLIARNRQNLKLTAIIQPLTTLFSIAIAALSLLNPATNHSYTTWILVGLGLCFVADIFNIDMNNDKIFLAGIITFIFAYSEYAVTFTIFNKGFHYPDIYISILFIFIYVFLMCLYWKGMGKYKLPIMIYGIFMPFMVTRALSTLFAGVFPMASAISDHNWQHHGFPR